MDTYEQLRELNRIVDSSVALKQSILAIMVTRQNSQNAYLLNFLRIRSNCVGN